MINISVIIPAYNSANGLIDTLNAILCQEDFDLSCLEMIIVDNNSTDNTLEVLEEFRSKFLNFKVLSQPKIGSYAARNMGIEHATGKWFCFIDADVEPEKMFFNKVLKAFEQEVFDYAGVNVQIKRETNSLASDYDALKAFHVEEKMRKGNYTPTITAIVKKEVIDKIGGFDDRMESGGDVVFGKLIHEHGYVQHYLGDVIVMHPARERLSSLIKKAKRVARGYAYHMYYYKHMFNHEQKFFKKLSFYLPNNPFSLLKISKERELNITPIRCIMASCVAIPLAFITRSEYYSELRKLRNNRVEV